MNLKLVMACAKRATPKSNSNLGDCTTTLKFLDSALKREGLMPHERRQIQLFRMTVKNRIDGLVAEKHQTQQQAS